MAITIDYSDRVTPRYVIQIPRADMPVVSITPSEVRELDMNAFRLTLNDLMDDAVPGIVYETNHNNTAPLTVAGVTLARVVEILPPYVLEFEDGLYSVNIINANSNVADVVVKNSVGVNTANSAGLIEVNVAGDALTPAEVWDHVLGDGIIARNALLGAFQALLNNSTIITQPDDSNVVTIFADDGTTPAFQFLISADGKVRLRQ